jgi:predicted metal-dependent peptidase
MGVLVINPTTEQAERIRLARVALTRQGAFPYYYPIAFKMTLVETTRVPTAGVDNRLRLYYNPHLVGTLSEPELLGLLWHEVQHPARDHLSERGLPLIRFIKGALADRLHGEEAFKRLQEVYQEVLGQEEAFWRPGAKGQLENPSTEDLILWMVARDVANVSFDLEINDDAEAAGVKLPPWVVSVEQFGFPRGLTGEEYALRILDKLWGQGQGQSQGQGQGQTQDQDQDQGQGQSQAQDQGQGQRQGSSDNPSGDGGRGDRFIDALREFIRKVPRDIIVEEVAQELEREHPELREAGVSEAVARVAIRQTAEEIVKQASKEPGSVPAGILRTAEAILKPRVDWRSVLRAKVGKALVDLNARERPTYHRPHRRQGALGNVLLPGAYGLKPEVAVVIDTSGSMGEKELGQALGELKALLRHHRPTVYTVDAEVHTAQKVFSLDQVRLLGGGGTDMGRGIEKAVEDGHDLVVVLTDGYTPWPEKAPRATVVVGLIHDKGESPPEAPPWAKVVPIPVSRE